MPDKVLVTGANGFLGSNITKQLIRAGYRVIVLLRKGSNRTSLRNVKCEYMEGNITDIYDVEKAVSECDYVIHCAANTGQGRRISEFIEPNIWSTANLLVCSAKYSVKRFVYISTVNCFTNGTKKQPGDETGSFMPWMKRSAYAYSKHLAQKMVLEEIEKGFPALIVAPAFLIGAGDAKISSGKLLLYGLKKRIIFYPPGGKSFVDAEFAAEAVVNALTKGVIGNSYLLAGRNLSYSEFFEKLKNRYNPGARLVKIPYGLLRAASLLMNLFRWLTPGSFVFTETNQRLLCLDNYFSNQKARDQLGLKPTDIDTSIQKAYEWYKEMHYI